MPEWSSESDWDNAQSESGVVHENTANTDHNDATIVKQGYSSVSPYKSTSLVGLWPLNEDSGSTAYDFSGNNNDGVITSATVNSTNLLNTSSYSFDGSNDNVSIPNDTTINFGSGDFHIIFWFNMSSTNHNARLINKYEDTSDGIDYRIRESGNRNAFTCAIDDGSTKSNLDTNTSLSNVTDNTWHMMSFGRNGGTEIRCAIDANNYNTISDETGNIDTTANLTFAEKASTGGDNWSGKMSWVHIYDTYLTEGEVGELYDIVNTSGSLTTDTKTL